MRMCENGMYTNRLQNTNKKFVRQKTTYKSSDPDPGIQKIFFSVRCIIPLFHPLLQIANLYRFVATFVAGFWNSIRSHTTANFAVTHVREWRTKVASTCAFPFCALLITTQLEKVTIWQARVCCVRMRLRRWSYPIIVVSIVLKSCRNDD